MVTDWEHIGTLREFMGVVPTDSETMERHLEVFRALGLLNPRGIEETRRAIKRVWDGTSEAFIGSEQEQVPDTASVPVCQEEVTDEAAAAAAVGPAAAAGTTAAPRHNSWLPAATLVDLLRLRAEMDPDECTYTFLMDGEAEEERISNKELYSRARAIAGSLQGLRMQGESALLLYPSGLDFVVALFGCFLAGVVAVPVYPPRRNASLLKIEEVAADSRAKVALTSESATRRIEPLLNETRELRDLRWIRTDEVAPEVGEQWEEPRISGEDVALLNYTSGSTGFRKGVILTHSNFLNNTAASLVHICHKRSSVALCWLPLYHDLGLLSGILQPLYGGYQSVLMSPMAFLQKPLRWLKAIARYDATISGGPNFAYDLCVRRIRHEDCRHLDLSSWDVAFIGGEPIRGETLNFFTEMFERYGFRRKAFLPYYALAEATVIASGCLAERPPTVCAVDSKLLRKDMVFEIPLNASGSRHLVGCGQPLPDHEIRIVDPEKLTERADGYVGEIWIRGPSVGQGYRNRAKEPERTFGARLNTSGEGPYLRTGDVGFMRMGEVFCCGRLQDLIALEGRHYYPEDIEFTVGRSHPAFRPRAGAAFVVEVVGRKQPQLTVVQEVDRRSRWRFAAEDLVRSIRGAVAAEQELEVDNVVLIRAGTIPMTSSGKIQRSECCRQFVDGLLSIVTAWPEELQSGGRRDRTQYGESMPIRGKAAEESAVAAWAAVVNTPSEVVFATVRDVSNERDLSLSLDTDIRQLGLDSIALVEIITRLERIYGAPFPESVAPDVRTCRDLVGAIQKHLIAPEEVPYGLEFDEVLLEDCSELVIPV